MRRFPRWSIAGIVAVTWACRPELELVPPQAHAPPDMSFRHAEPAARVPCPHDWPQTLTFDPLGQNVDVTIDEELSGPGTLTNIVEFHDCQRFVDRTLTAYDSVFAIFAVQRLTRLDSLAQASRGQQLAISDPNYLAGTEWLPTALVIAWNDYPSLGIETGFNCLYLSYVSQGPSPGWQAAMYHFDFTEPECSSAVSDSAMGSGQLPLAAGGGAAVTPTLLTVSESRDSGLSKSEDYPAVTRWEWDAVSGQYYIGHRCPDASWCEIGNSVTSAPTYASRAIAEGNGGSLSYTGRFRVTQAKGWYDEQILAERDPVTDQLKPSGVLGTLIPVPELDRLDSPEHFSDDWVQVAWAALEDLSGGQRPNLYANKSNLHLTDRGAPLDRLNKIFLCEGQGCACPDGTSQCNEGQPLGPGPCRKLDGSASDGTWWARIEHPNGGSNKVLCVVRHAMDNIPIPGTVRWRWLETDEDEWIRCPEGCCELLNGGG